MLHGSCMGLPAACSVCFLSHASAFHQSSARNQISRFLESAQRSFSASLRSELATAQAHVQAASEAGRRQAASTGLRHISGADLDLILGAPDESSRGVAALLQGLELPA